MCAVIITKFECLVFSEGEGERSRAKEGREGMLDNNLCYSYVECRSQCHKSVYTCAYTKVQTLGANI